MILVEGTSEKFNLGFLNRIPEKYQDNIKKAYYLLKDEGCKSVYLFGSMVTGNIRDNSDIDIGIKGLPEGKFFRAYSTLMFDLGVEFDLVDFDFSKDFFSLLEDLGEIIEIGW